MEDQHAKGCRRRPGCIKLNEIETDTHLSMIMGGLQNMEHQLTRLEEESLQWDVEKPIGTVGTNWMQHSTFVWCTCCMLQSVVSYESYCEVYTGTCQMHTSRQCPPNPVGDSRVTEQYYKCPIAYYASILSCKGLLEVKDFEFDGVEDELLKMVDSLLVSQGNSSSALHETLHGDSSVDSSGDSSVDSSEYETREMMMSISLHVPHWKSMRPLYKEEKSSSEEGESSGESSSEGCKTSNTPYEMMDMAERLEAEMEEAEEDF